MQKLIRHGGLILSAVVTTGTAAAQTPVPVQSGTVEIHYAVNEGALPLDSVRLWYTMDDGQSWKDFGLDEDRQSPFVFHAPQEGLYGFFLVMTNRTGPSSVPPTAATKPQIRAFVDETPPVVQLHPLRASTSGGRRVLHVRWTAIDQHFGPRPIELTYQRPPDRTWYPLTADPIANTGRYDWIIPDELTGQVSIRVTVQDRGGHRVLSSAAALTVAPSEIDKVPSGRASSVRLTGETPPPSAPLPVSPWASQRAAQLLSEAIEYRRRGDYGGGIARLREAVRLNPNDAQAFAKMADMLYRLGETDRALDAYELALRREPTMRAALRGEAMVYRKKNDNAAAAGALRLILQHDPNDAETWMNLGDVAIFQGDEIMAREYYTRAMRIESAAPDVVAGARKRLKLMADVSRTYRPGGSP